ncbi:MAG: DNA gyrase subunit A [Clostridia bacterium]|nr:DNA gyrase subunit A [Clostridia bacterium]
MEEILSKTKIIPVNIIDQMSKCFISYAMAVNKTRAIPDVRDGLKPVHRRILFGMYDMGNTYDQPTKKCARIVGEVMGKYHPHGDSSVYDALVRLAQWFSINEPLVTGQGNFGTVDGDPAAASRYTEAKLSKIANEMLRDIDKETVDFMPNFDDTLQQPVVLPARFPNLLVNGSEGIAVGMATSIPPHNLVEVVNGTVALLDNPDMTVDELIKYIPAPDYPTGGIVLGKSQINEAYRTGHGGVVIRAKAEIEEYNGMERIIVTQIPYQVNKANMIKNIVDQIKDKKIDGISNLRDESSRQGMRIVFEIKRDANASVVLNTLYKQSQLQISTGINFLALSHGKPLVLNLKEVLTEYLDHQKDVIVRRAKFDLAKAQEREHIVKGLIIAVNNIDKVVEIIKKSPDTKEAMTSLMEEFDLTERQAKAIIEMRLGALTNLQVEKLMNEEKELVAKIADLTDFISNDERIKNTIKEDLLAIAEKYGNPRKSEISYDDADIDIEDLIVKEDVVISMTNEGYIKRMSASEYKAQNRGGMGVSGHKLKQEDIIKKMFICHSHSDILFFSNSGKAYKLKAYKVPEATKQSKGRSVINFLPLDENEKITAFLPIDQYETGYILMQTKKGLIRKSETGDFESVRQNGKIAVSLEDGDELIAVETCNEEDNVFVASHKGKCIIFSQKDVRKTGRGSQGVRAIKLDNDDYVVDMSVVHENDVLLTLSEKGFGKRTGIENYRVQSRAGKGIKAGVFNDKTGLLVSVKPVNEDEDIIIVADNGTIIRIRASQVSMIGRSTKGVTIMKLKGDAKIVSMAITMHDDEAEFNDVEIDENELKEAQKEAGEAKDDPIDDGNNE